VSTTFDLIVIGGGPGGYVAAIRASQLGMNVALVEREALGGVCLNWGCIPTKTLLKSAQVFETVKKAGDYGVNVNLPTADLPKMVSRSRSVVKEMNAGIQYLIKKNKIHFIAGTGKIVGQGNVSVTNADGEEIVYQAPHVILATGAKPKELRNIPFDGRSIISSSEAMMLSRIPVSITIVGAGAIGVEFAYFFNALGSDVRLVEYASRILPLEDQEISQKLKKSFEKKGIAIDTDCNVVSAIPKSDKVEIQANIQNKKTVFSSEIVLVAAGIETNTSGIGLEDNGVEVDRGKIVVDQYYRTTLEGVYAIGDIVSGPALAHVASAEAVLCVEKIAGLPCSPINYDNIPSCIYSSPEIASVGMTEQAAKQAGINVKKGSYPFSASGKAKAMGDFEGGVSVLYDEDTREIIGAHMIGPNVTELISEIVVARELESTPREIVRSVHPHPTMSEAIVESLLDLEKASIHA